VTLSEAGRENQDSSFHLSLGNTEQGFMLSEAKHRGHINVIVLTIQVDNS
jgi:hypothetical protein